MAKSVFAEEYRALLGCLIGERKAAGLTQQKLAHRLRGPQSYISKYETGERRLDVIEFLAVMRALDADPCDIIQSIERSFPPESPR